jgi:hypothetical protein
LEHSSRVEQTGSTGRTYLSSKMAGSHANDSQSQENHLS